MRMVVDLNKCLGYAECVPLAPKALKLNGEEVLMYDPNPDDSQRLQILRAADLALCRRSSWTALTKTARRGARSEAYHLLHDGKIKGRAVITPNN